MIKYTLVGLLFFNYIYAQKVNIAVAANVSYAMDELKSAFKKKYPKSNVKVTLGSSGKLTAQIKHGAPYDVFISANMDYPNFLYENNIALTKPTIYAKGALAILSNNQRSFRHGIKLLTSKLVKRVAIANPKTAPYGKATMQALKNANIFDEIRKKIIYGESISQTLSYTAMAADVGIVAKSSLFSKKMGRYKQNVHWVDVDKKLYSSIKQGIVLLKRAKSNEVAKKFYEFMLSKEAKAILKRYGYMVE